MNTAYSYLWNVLLQEFVFPEGLSVPLGGDGAPQYVVIEMHYDNPSLESGKFVVITNSHYWLLYSP